MVDSERALSGGEQEHRFVTNKTTEMPRKLPCPGRGPLAGNSESIDACMYIALQVDQVSKAKGAFYTVLR